MKKGITVLLVLAIAALALFAAPALAEEKEEAFAEWNSEAPALKALIEYVEDVTDETSENYIPTADRIATFDMDGTLCAELYPTYLEYWLLARRIFCDPGYTPDEEMLEFGRILRDHTLDKSFPDGMDVLHGEHAARTYTGMTLTEFADFVTNQLVRDVDGFEGMTYANTFYAPMVEVVEYLQENGFKVYVCSGSDRFICRTFIEGMVDIPYEQIIGMDVDVEATNEDGVDGLKYVYTKEDSIVRTDRLLIKNLKMNKVAQIVKEIGRQPVLSFGNSGGDVSMHNYTRFSNRYRSAAFMLVADDGERDYGNAEKVQPLREKWEGSGYQVISMKDDFRTIYGDDVIKTGTFHWLEDLAEDRTPAGD
jgi:phosphoserine phosphatase